MNTQIALIHATRAAVEPIEAAFADLWPEAAFWNLLDDGLSREIDRTGKLTGGLTGRLVDLAAYAANTGADGIVFTCSAFGPAIEECQRRFAIPVLKPNDALFEKALEIGGEIGLLATHPPALPVLKDQLERSAREAGQSISVRPALAEGAWEALQSGHRDTHDAAVAATAEKLAECGCILLAQFSMAPLAKPIAAAVTPPVLTGPHTAVEKMKEMVSET